MKMKQNKLDAIEYLSKLSKNKVKKYNDPRYWLNRIISYFEYWLKGERAIGFQLDFKNVDIEIEEMETHIKTIIKMIDGNSIILDECLIHFQTAESQYPVVGREYCINVLKSARIRLR
jgi:hypothetical protein